jgi:DNA-directed RNA polymerase subunit RPC12/RpoP
MKEDKLKTYVKVSCPCGNTVRIDTMTQARSFKCPRCSSQIGFVVTMDRATKRPKVSIVVAPDAIRIEGESLGHAKAEEMSPPPTPRPRPDAEGVFGTCACGEEFLVDDEELTTIQPCPRCGVKYHVVVKMDRATKVRSAILVPVDGVKPQKSRSLSPQMLKATRTVKRAVAPEKTRVKTVPPKPVRKPAPVIPPGAQGVDCPCGATLVARRQDVEAGLSCPECGRALRLMEDRHPQTLAPWIRVRPDPKK